MWVRGYVTHPDGNAIIINGYNILGMYGILRANIAEDDTVTYDILYANANQGGGNWIHLIKWENDGWSSGTEFVLQREDQYSSTYGQNLPVYEWIPDILTNDVVDETKALNRVRGYFYGDISFKDFNSFKNNLTKTINGYYYNWNSGSWIDGSSSGINEFLTIYDDTTNYNKTNDPWPSNTSMLDYWNNWGVAHKIQQDPETRRVFRESRNLPAFLKNDKMVFPFLCENIRQTVGMDPIRVQSRLPVPFLYHSTYLFTR